MSINSFGSNSQSLSFLDNDDAEFCGGDTQGTDFDFTDFTFSSQSSNHVISTHGHSNALRLKSSKKRKKGKKNPPIYLKPNTRVGSIDEITLAIKELTIPPPPPEAEVCKYCKVANPACLVKCNVCKHWFCNGRGSASTSGSHIIQHLVRAKHREVTLHKLGPLGETVLECFSCGVRNVFVLGFLPATTDSLVMVLCRQPCAGQQVLKNFNWDQDGWKPLISNRSLAIWLVKEPTEDDMKDTVNITRAQIMKLEDLWAINPDACLEEAEQPEEEVFVERARLRYDDGNQYRNTMAPLITLESDYDKQMKESQAQENVIVRWETGLNKKVVAYFCLPKLSEGDVRIMHGDELLLRTMKNRYGSLKHGLTKEWSGIGNVIKIPNNFGDEIALEMRSKVAIIHEPMAVEFIWKSTSFDRMHNALRKFAADPNCLSDYIYHRLMGHTQAIDSDIADFDAQKQFPLPKQFSAPNLPELNRSQMFAVKQALRKPLSLIQGPPGTGKTVVSATIIYHLVMRKNGSSHPILVCAPSNTAVDQLTEKIHLTGMRVVRVAARSRETIDSSVSHLALHNQVKLVKMDEEFEKLQRLKDDTGELSSADEKRYEMLRKAVERDLLLSADVICTTCTGAGDSRISQIRFHSILIDESMQATEPECLIPIVLGVKQLILVGDHCQLGPVVTNKRAAKCGLNQSLFERLVVLGNTPCRLEVQYRMHPDLAEFPSNFFYEGGLQNGVAPNERTLSSIHNLWNGTDKPMLFLVSQGQEEMAGSGTTYLNRTEAAFVERITTKYLKSGVRPKQIGIITPYEGQRAFLVNCMIYHGELSQKLYQDVEIASVDAFQGREKDIIIMSCVRSNGFQGIGFLNDPRRLNVALTRAKYALIIVGNPTLLSREPLWNNLISFYKENGVLVEGPLTNLKPTSLTFPKARPLTNPHNPGQHFMSMNTYSARDVYLRQPFYKERPGRKPVGGPNAFGHKPFGGPNAFRNRPFGAPNPFASNSAVPSVGKPMPRISVHDPMMYISVNVPPPTAFPVPSGMVFNNEPLHPRILATTIKKDAANNSSANKKKLKAKGKKPSIVQLDTKSLRRKKKHTQETLSSQDALLSQETLLSQDFSAASSQNFTPAYAQSFSPACSQNFSSPMVSQVERFSFSMASQPDWKSDFSESFNSSQLDGLVSQESNFQAAGSSLFVQQGPKYQASSSDLLNEKFRDVF